MKKLLVAFLATSLIALSGCNSESTGDKTGSGMIAMPANSVDYVGSEYSLDSLKAEFEALGFHNFVEHPLEVSDENYDMTICSVETQGFLGIENPWEKGDEFNPNTTIAITYNEQPMMTVKDCPELADMIDGSEDYRDFAEQHDGRYVSFDAWISSRTEGLTPSDVYIEVSGGDYEYNQSHGNSIHIGDRNWRNEIRDDCEEGAKVHVEGKVDLKWSEFYDQLYIECIKLHPIE